MASKIRKAAQNNSSKIGIVIPAYNEAGVISDVLDDVEKAFSNKTAIIIVVNDGSSDTTSQEVAKHKKVILIDHIINMGAGAATRTGLGFAKSAGCEYAVTMDSDGQHHVDDVIKLAKEIRKSKADFIIGSRLIDAQGMPWYRIIGNKFLNFITLILFGVFVSDSQSGLKALNRKALEHIEYRSNNYAFCSEMIWQAKRAKLKIKEISIRAIYTDYSLTKGQSNLDVVHILRQLIKQRLMDLLNG